MLNSRFFQHTPISKNVTFNNVPANTDPIHLILKKCNTFLNISKWIV